MILFPFCSSFSFPLKFFLHLRSFLCVPCTTMFQKGLYTLCFCVPWNTRNVFFSFFSPLLSDTISSLLFLLFSFCSAIEAAFTLSVPVEFITYINITEHFQRVSSREQQKKIVIMIELVILKTTKKVSGIFFFFTPCLSFVIETNSIFFSDLGSQKTRTFDPAVAVQRESI